MREIIGVDPDAVSSDKSWLERQKVPFRSRGGEHLVRVDSDQMENFRKLIDECDVQVPLGVFNDFCRFRHLDAACLVRAAGQNGSVKGVHNIRRFGSRSRSDLQNSGQRVFAVAGIDSLRTVSAEEIAVECKPAVFFQNRNAFLLRAAGEHRALKDHDRAGSHHFPDGFTGAVQRSQIWLLVLIHRSRNRHDEDVAVAHFRGIGGIFEIFCGGKVLRRRFQRYVHSPAQHVETVLLDVETDRIKPFSEFHRKRKSDISESDQRQLDRSILNFVQYHFCLIVCHGFSISSVHPPRSFCKDVASKKRKLSCPPCHTSGKDGFFRSVPDESPAPLSESRRMRRQMT